MKASRLLAMLLLLQTHGRMTTTHLAERLEVSRRTILRDVDAMSGAGVPVYAERGRHGAIVLMSEARLNASHLDPDELDLLLLAGLDREAIELLDLGVTARSSALKLSARRPKADGHRLRLADVIVVENSGWASEEKRTDVAGLASTLLEGRRLHITYRRSGQTHPAPLTVDPYGLAVKGGRWYLVADVDEHPRLFALTRLSRYRALDERSRHRPGRDLGSVWEELKSDTEPRDSIEVEALIRTDRVDLARRILGSRLVATSIPGDATADGRSRITVRYDHPEAVRQLLQFGDHIEILAPPRARQRVHDLALELARTHADAASPVNVSGRYG